MFLEERLKISTTIPGTQKLHCFIPQCNNKVLTKMFLNLSGGKPERVTVLTKEEIPLNKIKGFVTTVYDKHWWLGCVIEVNEDENKVNVNLLIPHGPSQSFKYPVKERIVVVPIEDILTKVDPRASFGRTYTISREESKTAILSS